MWWRAELSDFALGALSKKDHNMKTPVINKVLSSASEPLAVHYTLMNSRNLSGLIGDSMFISITNLEPNKDGNLV